MSFLYFPWQERKKQSHIAFEPAPDPFFEAMGGRALQRDVIAYIGASICCVQLVSDQ
jgi:hypothetical protein